MQDKTNEVFKKTVEAQHARSVQALEKQHQNYLKYLQSILNDLHQIELNNEDVKQFGFEVIFFVNGSRNPVFAIPCALCEENRGGVVMKILLPDKSDIYLPSLQNKKSMSKQTNYLWLCSDCMPSILRFTTVLEHDRKLDLENQFSSFSDENKN